MFSNSIFKSMSKDESIIFRMTISKAETFKRNSKIISAIFIGLSLIFFIWMYFFIELYIGIDIFFTRSIFFTSFFIIVVILLCSFLSVMCIKANINAANIVEQLIITNKHIFKQNGRSETSPIECIIDLKMLSAVSFHLSKENEIEKVGNVQFAYGFDVKNPYILKLTGIPNFLKVQKIIESIVYYYADIEKRWELIRNKLNIKFPQKFTNSYNENMLILDSNKISLILPNNSISIPFDSSFSVDSLKIKPYIYKEYLYEISFHSSYESKNLIRFGPNDNFSEILETIFCYILKWKADNVILLSKKDIINYDLRKFDQIDNEHINKSPSQQNVTQRKENIDFKPIEKSNPLYLSFGKYLEPDEIIYFSFYEQHHYKIIVEIILGIYITAIIFASISFILDRLIDIYQLLMFTFLICFFLLPCFSVNLKKWYKMGNFLYLFTNKRLFVNYRSNTCQILYDNISMIKYRSYISTTYEIEIKLKKGINNNPFRITHGRRESFTDIFHIRKIPSDNNLIDKLIKLKEKVSIQ